MSNPCSIGWFAVQSRTIDGSTVLSGVPIGFRVISKIEDSVGANGVIDRAFCDGVDSIPGGTWGTDNDRVNG